MFFTLYIRPLFTSVDSPKLVIRIVYFNFFSEGCFGKHRRSSEPHLRILPSGKQEIRAGKNVVLTCRSQVPNLDLIRDMKWIDPRGKEIEQDER